jgi:hypothetical protein
MNRCFKVANQVKKEIDAFKFSVATKKIMDFV